ncbi:MAG TPA: pentapeptide repeat-containing protein [Polyangiaceae bacterium]|jgi:hypothetical protein|nr:pentapeptide repeat-containing protein [Polyangiaceae bacterium]
MTAKSKIAVTPEGSVAGIAWLQPSKPSVELHVVGKLTMLLLPDGQTSHVPRPELPGHHRGLPAPEELDLAAVRKVIVRGGRASPGRVVLRRGPTVLAEAAFAAGPDPVAVELSSTMQTTVAGRRGDEWLVVEAAGGPEARRWCKLPKLGILATWNEIERLVLTSRVCLVDTTTWTVSFVLRAARKLPAAMAPDAVRISIVDLAGGAPSTPGMAIPAGPPSPWPAAAAPAVASSLGAPAVAPPVVAAPRVAAPVVAPGLADDDGLDKTAIRQPAKNPLAALVLDDPTTAPPHAKRRPLDETTADEPKTRFVDVAKNLPAEALPDPVATRRADTRKPSSAGLRIGRSSASSPAIPAVVDNLASTVQREAISPRVHDEETTASAAVDAGPSSVTRAFAAVSPSAVPIKYELVRRIKEGASLAGLVLTGADLTAISVPGASLSGVDLSQSDLTGADLTGADLAAARLDGARLDGARLDEADFMCATLVGASLRAASLHGANFAGASLDGADISGAVPESAFAGASLTGARRG